MNYKDSRNFDIVYEYEFNGLAWVVADPGYPAKIPILQNHSCKITVFDVAFLQFGRVGAGIIGNYVDKVTGIALFQFSDDKNAPLKNISAPLVRYWRDIPFWEFDWSETKSLSLLSDISVIIVDESLSGTLLPPFPQINDRVTLYIHIEVEDIVWEDMKYKKHKDKYVDNLKTSLMYGQGYKREKIL